ncbi:hypothetical protein FRB99_001581 [Tulasnella sp. 403]|nr:hypothetical protein FRB99_001581 [Tulasnella sp. 403]
MAQVYLFPPSRLQHHTPPSLDAGEANAAIAQHLGFDVYETLGGSRDGALVGGHLPGPNGMGVGVGEGELDSVLVVVQSAYPQDFIPKDLKPAFTILSPLPAEAFTDLIHGCTERAHQMFENVISSFIASVQASPAYKQLFDVFDFVGGVGKDVADELGRLVGAVDDGQKTVGDGKDTFEAVEVKLAGLEKSYGRQSEVYGQAA